MKKRSTAMTTIAAVIFSFLWIYGFAWSIQDFYYGKAAVIEETESIEKEKSPINPGEKMTVVALGDSLTRGMGDETGKGYVGLVTDNLKKQLSPQEIIVYNLGIKGQTSYELLQQLSQKQMGRHIQEADLVLMTIGGNDLIQQGETLLNLDFTRLQQYRQQYLANLQQIFTIIREQNAQTPVFILGLYNPFIELENSNIANQIIREWNYETETLVGKFSKIVFVPTFDLFQLSVNDYLYSDHFHPNQAGYQLISDRLVPLIGWEKEGLK